ncbi:MAG TPA: restriction endonuclease [Candidatus Nanoarchaeia archaeon]|nr:restriction endonuclease [Candidatus Nanoarchaeia archaeon]
MPIPDFQSIMLPLLKFLEDKKEHTTKETVEHIISHFHLTDKEKENLLPSGKQSIISNRVGWARTYLKMGGLLENPTRGVIQINENGLNVLKKNPPKIDIKYLDQFQDFKNFRTVKKDEQNEIQLQQDITKETPEVAIYNGFQQIQKKLAQDVLDEVKKNSPKFFENLVVDLIVKMGYGGSRKDAGKIIGQSGDEGVDGVIKEDKLGLDEIYIQAKRWEGTVGRPEIQKFVGALQGKGVNRGIFITTGTFSKEAKDYFPRGTKIILVDGEKLAELMIEYNVGISTSLVYEIKKMDSDYFSEE